MKIEFLWFDECPSHEAARELLRSVLQAKQIDAPIADINASDPERAEQLRFPGSPTIRIDGEDIEPHFVDPGDYWPRCRLYQTESGLTGMPQREAGTHRPHL
jgi:hypothetical protein